MHMIRMCTRSTRMHQRPDSLSDACLCSQLNVLHVRPVASCCLDHTCCFCHQADCPSWYINDTGCIYKVFGSKRPALVPGTQSVSNLCIPADVFLLRPALLPQHPTHANLALLIWCPASFAADCRQQPGLCRGPGPRSGCWSPPHSSRSVILASLVICSRSSK